MRQRICTALRENALKRDDFSLNRWDSQISVFVIHDAGWKEASMGGQTSFSGSTQACCSRDRGRDVAQSGSQAIWRCDQHGNRLDASAGGDRQCRGRSDGRPQTEGNLGDHAVWLSQRIRDGDFTIRRLVAELAGRSVKVDYHSVWDFVHAENLSLKKSVAAGEHDRPDVARRRAQWTKYQDRVDPERLVFIDWDVDQDRYGAVAGWAARGRRLAAKLPHGRWKTWLSWRHCAMTVLMRLIDGESFRTYVAEVLPLTLHPGDIVILNNLGSHTSKAVRQLIRSVGAKLLFLPNTRPTWTQQTGLCQTQTSRPKGPPLEPSTPYASQSAKPFKPSHPKNAPTISKTQATEPNFITL
jgi:hypothetical protein